MREKRHGMVQAPHACNDDQGEDQEFHNERIEHGASFRRGLPAPLQQGVEVKIRLGFAEVNDPMSPSQRTTCGAGVNLRLSPAWEAAGG
jgi:hypothetical protein